MRLTTKCKYCQKNLIINQTLPFKNPDGTPSGRSLITYKCGHVEITSKNLLIKDINWKAIDGEKEARDYQKQGIQFALESNLNCIIGDQMRLGKTPQSLIALREARFGKIEDSELIPTLIIVKSANLWQWIPEYKTWASNSLTGIYPIVGTKNFIPPGFETYIISMDTFSRKGMAERLSAMKFKCVIVDEAHSFKNTDSKRSQALVDFIKNNEIKHKMFLTGTPIKNRAEEFFVLLNLVAPAKFPSLEHFRRRWLEQDEKGKWSRISRYAKDLFKEEVSPFFIRREKEDVYTDLPRLDRIYTPIKIEEDHFRNLYNKAVSDLEEKALESGYSYWALQENLMFLRRICGMAKLQFITDYTDVFLEDSESAKLAIGIHHKDVRDTLKYNLQQYKPLTLSGEDNAERKNAIMRASHDSNNRLFIINMLAGGVGMDFHPIDNVIVAERAWSPADEEQFEFRFYNPDKSIKDRPTMIEYIIAEGTVDSFFHDLVREKRQIFGETIGTNWNLQEDPGSFRDLIERTVASRI